MSSMTTGPTEPSSAVPIGGGAPAIPYANPATPAIRARVPLFSAEAWTPLKIDLFRSLYIATSIAQIGTWVREAGGPWLMHVLTDGHHDSPEMIARVVVFSSLPICFFSVFAGALADVLDRRRLLIVTQVWMMVVSAILGVLTISGKITPGMLLGLTFLVGTGTAMAGPALQALLPELVPRKDLALAINLNSVALNVARALGPAMFIVVISLVPGQAGVGVSFLVTAASFIWAVWVLVRWKRPRQVAAVHGEEMWGAIRAGFKYTVHSPANRAILLRVFTFIVPAVILWTQIPVIATSHLGLPRASQEQTSALLFAFVGIGAIFGVLLMPGLHARYRIDPVVNVCTAFFALGLIILAGVHNRWLACIVMIFLGINWVIIPTNFNTATQKSVPLWVKGRAISFYLTVLFGSFAVGGAIWGRVTAHYTTPTHPGIGTSLFLGGVSMGILLVLARWFPLTINEGLDLTAAFAGAPPRPVLPDITPPQDPNAGPLPETGATPAGLDPRFNPSLAGPVRVSLQYDVHPTRVEEFLMLMRPLGRQRRRNGASSWRLEPAAPTGTGAVTYLEMIHYRSTTEYARQAARMTKDDILILEKARAFHTGAGELPARGEILTGDAADPNAAIKNWMLTKLGESFDRFFEETAATFDRFTALRSRDRKIRKPTYREIRLRVPE
ncbi:MAG TPA: MFS transporter [Tepidisphaeraceae bacterium]|nr:MFS transporter [Tepidisphaeraceae bacterium]